MNVDFGLELEKVREGNESFRDLLQEKI